MSDKRKKERRRVTFAGVTFSGIVWGGQAPYDNYVTVPVPAFRKMLAGGKLSPHLNFDIEHDGNGSYDTFNKDIEAERVRAWCDEQLKRLEWLGRPHLLYLDLSGEKPVMGYSVHSNLSYRVSEAEVSEPAVEAAA